MKIVILLLTLSFDLYAASLSIMTPCDEPLLFRHSFHLGAEGSNVGKQTISTLTQLEIPFEGAEQGISSIFNTPTGLDAIEVISDTEMNAYGWCYSVNGFEPGTYPNEFSIKQQDSILWWYGFAKYKGGKWITQCTPSHERKDSEFCKNLQF